MKNSENNLAQNKGEDAYQVENSGVDKQAKSRSCTSWKRGCREGQDLLSLPM